MITIDFDLSGLRAAVDDAERQLDRDLDTAVARTVRTGADEMRRFAQEHRKSGALAGSVTERMTGPASGYFEASAEHASYMEQGTPAHVIEPKAAKVLHWVDGGEHRFARRVQHPGTQPYKFAERATEVARSVLEREVALAVARIAERLNR